MFWSSGILTGNQTETGMGFYEALKDGLDAAVGSKWMAEFAPELVRKTTQTTPTV